MAPPFLSSLALATGRADACWPSQLLLEDEDELEEEYAAMLEENAVEQMESLPSIPTTLPENGRMLAQRSLEDVLPVAPQGNVVPAGRVPVAVGGNDDDDDLAALEAMMA